MTSPAAASWKSSLSALDRYDVVRKIQASLPDPSSPSEAIAIEQRAYDSATGRDEYEAACDVSAGTDVLQPPARHHERRSSSPQSAVRVGPYHDCVFVSNGATSEVYRSGDVALKVIVAHRAMEPHNPQREARILCRLRPPCVPLLDVFRDQEQRLVLKFPFMPLTLAQLLEHGPPTQPQLRAIFTDILRALQAIHAQGIIHRDVKPSAILLSSPYGPCFLSDFGTAWHPELSTPSEPTADKILDIGTGPYRAPEVLFGDKAYGSPIDMWALGVMLAEAIRSPPAPPFESRPVDEDGNQLGLILSIFKTLGTPTHDSWPEARALKVSPFDLWNVFPARSWLDILPAADPLFRDLVAALVRYDGQRASAAVVCPNPQTASVFLQSIAYLMPPYRPLASPASLRIAQNDGHLRTSS